MSAMDKKRDHSFDGIYEYDNPLPTWWLWLFYVTIAIALVYGPWKHWPGGERGQEQIYAAEMAAALAKWGDLSKVTFKNEELVAHFEKGEWKESGRKIFVKNCAACHRADGGGKIGPNFHDDYYIHGGRLADIATTITLGVPEKGMLTWGGELPPNEIKDVTCYVQSLRGTPVERPKAPQGKLVDADGVPIQKD